MTHLTDPHLTARRGGMPKSREREAVESVLQAARTPLDANQIATRSGANVNRVRVALNHLLTDNRIHRRDPLRDRLHRYAWGPAPVVHATVLSSRTPKGEYDGRDLQPYAGRPGALHAFTLPSLHNGERTERRTPMLLGSTRVARKPQ
jgi:hypothetical protein